LYQYELHKKEINDKHQASKGLIAIL